MPEYAARFSGVDAGAAVCPPPSFGAEEQPDRARDTHRMRRNNPRERGKDFFISMHSSVSKNSAFSKGHYNIGRRQTQGGRRAKEEARLTHELRVCSYCDIFVTKYYKSITKRIYHPSCRKIKRGDRDEEVL